MSRVEEDEPSSPHPSFIFAPEAASTPRTPKRTTLDFQELPSYASSASSGSRRPRQISRTTRQSCPREVFNDQDSASPPLPIRPSTRNQSYASNESSVDVANHPEWQRLKQQYRDDMHTLLTRQQEERELLPFQGKYLNLKHAVEVDSLEFHYDKEEVKLTRKLKGRLKYSLKDRDMFGSIFEEDSEYVEPVPNRRSTVQQSTVVPSFYNRSSRNADVSNLCNSAVANSGMGGGGRVTRDVSDAGMKDEIVNMAIRRQRILGAVGGGVGNQTYPCPGKQRAVDRIHMQLRRNLTAEVKDLYRKYKRLSDRESVLATAGTSTFMSMSSYAIHADDTELSNAEQFAAEALGSMQQAAQQEAKVHSKYSPRNANDSMYMYQQGANEEIEDALVKQWNTLEREMNSSAPRRPPAPDNTRKLEQCRTRLMLQVLEAQYLLRDAMEKRQDVQPSCMSEEDFVELDAFQSHLADDIWGAFEMLKDKGETEAIRYIIDDNSNIICDAFLALFLQAKDHIENVLMAPRREAGEVFAMIRYEMNEELMKIIDSLITSDDANMTCQEKRLKMLQAAEKQALFEKYEKIANAHPCKLKVAESKLMREMNLLDSIHRDQWAQLMSSKLKFKADEIYRLQQTNDGPSSAASRNNSMRSSAYQQNASSIPSVMRSSINARNRTNCSCASDKQPSQSLRMSNYDQLQRKETSEIDELQESLRQWQAARRSLLETINSDIQKTR